MASDLSVYLDFGFFFSFKKERGGGEDGRNSEAHSNERGGCGLEGPKLCGLLFLHI